MGIVGLVFIPVGAQEEKEIKLDEVEVTAARTTTTPEGLKIVPTDWQKNHSASAYGLLQRQALHGIRIDEVQMSIQTINPQESVQIRINDIVASKTEVLKISPKDVKSIDFIDNPSLRYGEGINYVINITTRRGAQGYTVGANANNTLTSRRGNNSVFGSYINGKSELGLSYSQKYSTLKDNKTAETASYLLNSGDWYGVSRTDRDSRTTQYGNDVQLTYNLSAEKRYTLYLSAALGHANTPTNYAERLISDENGDFIANNSSLSHSLSPTFDLYYNVRLNPKNSLTANVNATLIRTKMTNSNDEGGLYTYDVSGRARSLRAEVIYESRMKPFTLSVGGNYYVKHTANDYLGDVNAGIRFMRQDAYLFAQVNGRLGKTTYLAGVGGSYQTYRQAARHWTYWTCRPKATIGYAFTNNLSAKYTYELLPYTSAIASVNDTQVKVNAMEWQKGNPDLKGYRRQEHDLSLSFTKQRFFASLIAHYRINRHPNMQYYQRTADNSYVSSQKNMGKVNMLYTMAQVSYTWIPEKLTTFVYGGVYRFFNYAETYRHRYTSFNGGASIQAYLGRWTLGAYADNGWNYMECERESHNGYNASLSAAYKVGNFTAAVYWAQPLDHKTRQSKTKLLSEMVRKTTTVTSSDYGNSVIISLTWRLSKGKKATSGKKPTTYKDTDSGILK